MEKQINKTEFNEAKIKTWNWTKFKSVISAQERYKDLSEAEIKTLFESITGKKVETKLKQKEETNHDM